MNATSLNSINYCVLPSFHSHSDGLDISPADLSTFVALADDDATPQDLSFEQSIVSNTAAAKGQLLDPYIDAVQVRGRINNKRGSRVEAATDHEPRPSYHSKTVHMEESGESLEDWDYSSGDSDDEHDDHYKGKKHAKRRRKKKKKGPGKKIYLGVQKKAKKKKKKKKKHDGYYYKHQQPKKTIYVKHVKPKEGHYYKHHDDHYADKHYDHYELSGYGHHGHHHHGHHHSKHYGKSKGGKLVHLDLAGKGKMSLAGLLGATLLCVNYLLVLKQPTYDKFTGSYYTKYAPHGGHGDTVELKSGGPVILAHCGELPESRSLVHIRFARSTAAADKNLEPQSANLTRELSLTGGRSELPVGEANMSPEHSNKSLVAAEQQAELVHLRDRSRSSPSYYYALSAFSNPTAGGQVQHLLNDYRTNQPTSLDRSFLSPISTYLNRLLFSGHSNLQGERQQAEDLPVQVLREVQRQSRLLGNQNGQQQRATVTGRLGRLVVSGQPQVVQTRDNLAELRRRQIEIGFRVAEGRRFGLSQRALTLTNWPPPVERPGAQLGLAVRAPETASGEAGGNEGEQSQAGPPSDGNQLVGLPDYALSGDSVELTCNHRLSVDQLHSVRWFRDSSEFYRFVPADAPRTKSALLLLDLDLDLARSNSHSVLLRNVSHRSSGLYRCEATSGWPQFEMMSGERQVRIYSLPDTGPQLSLLERGAQLAPQVSIGTASLARRVVSPSGEVEDEVEDDALPRGVPTRTGQRQSGAPRADERLGPIVRCASDRSNPAAQLRFFINNRPVELARTLENTTMSYSDSLESNLVSLRLQLSDFAFDEAAEGALEKAASLKSRGGVSGGHKTPTIQPTTATTTSSTTRRPSSQKSSLARHKARQMDRKNPNASVRFDDQLGGSSKKAGKRPKSSSERPRANEPDGPVGRGPDEADDLQESISTLSSVSGPETIEKLSSAGAGGTISSRKQPILAAAEQNVVRSTISPAAGQQQRQVYSNFVRIRCQSLVPALGYEMTSELAVPLALLVPASRLSDAIRSASLSAESRRAEEGETSSRRQSARNGGSLQAPRVVVTDRLAQASGPRGSTVVYEHEQEDGNNRWPAWRRVPVERRAASAGSRLAPAASKRSLALMSTCLALLGEFLHLQLQARCRRVMWQ